MVTKHTWEFVTSLRNTESVFGTLLGSFMTSYNHFLSLEGCQEAGTTQAPQICLPLSPTLPPPQGTALDLIGSLFSCDCLFAQDVYLDPVALSHSINVLNFLEDLGFGHTKTEWIAMNFCFCPSRCLSWVSEHWINSLIKLGWDEILNTEEEENQFNSTKHDLSIMVFNFTPQYKSQTVVECLLSK